MIYHDFQGLKLSGLGFGVMRLLVLEDGSVNEPLTAEMVHSAIEHGVNYFDTAYPYHGGMSEVVLGRALAAYPRDSFYLATKYPGHQLSDSYDPAAIFEEQLQKCGVEILREFLARYGDVMELCQIQLNYLDWKLQDARTKYEMLTERGIPVWVMEPVRGGRLAKLSPTEEAKLKALRPEESIPA